MLPARRRVLHLPPGAFHHGQRGAGAGCQGCQRYPAPAPVGR